MAAPVSLLSLGFRLFFCLTHGRVCLCARLTCELLSNFSSRWLLSNLVINRSERKFWVFFTFEQWRKQRAKSQVLLLLSSASLQRMLYLEFGVIYMTHSRNHMWRFLLYHVIKVSRVFVEAQSGWKSSPFSVLCNKFVRRIQKKRQRGNENTQQWVQTHEAKACAANARSQLPQTQPQTSSVFPKNKKKCFPLKSVATLAPCSPRPLPSPLHTLILFRGDFMLRCEQK